MIAAVARLRNHDRQLAEGRDPVVFGPYLVTISLLREVYALLVWTPERKPAKGYAAQVGAAQTPLASGSSLPQEEVRKASGSTSTDANMILGLEGTGPKFIGGPGDELGSEESESSIDPYEILNELLPGQSSFSGFPFRNQFLIYALCICSTRWIW